MVMVLHAISHTHMGCFPTLLVKNISSLNPLVFTQIQLGANLCIYLYFFVVAAAAVFPVVSIYYLLVACSGVSLALTTIHPETDRLVAACRLVFHTSIHRPWFVVALLKPSYAKHVYVIATDRFCYWSKNSNQF